MTFSHFLQQNSNQAFFFIILIICYILKLLQKQKSKHQEEMMMGFINVYDYPETTPDMYEKDIKLANQNSLTEGISSIKWMPKTNVSIFSSTFWDKTIKIFQKQKQSMFGPDFSQLQSIRLETFPLTSCWNGDQSALYIGCSDGTIKMFDLHNKNIIQVGKHNAAVHSLHYCQSKNLLISSAYENSIQVWEKNQNNPALTINLMNKVLCTDFKNNVMAGATTGQNLFFFDMDTISNIITQGETSDLGISSQIEWITLDKNAKRIGLASVDGRSNISNIIKQPNGKYLKKNQLSFKVNTAEENGTKILFPVNSCQFHPLIDDWFMTAGSDGIMSFWNLTHKCRIKSLKYDSNPIICASVSPDGRSIAYGNGNDWHLGTEGINKWKNRVGVHQISEQQKKTKNSL